MVIVCYNSVDVGGFLAARPMYRVFQPLLKIFIIHFSWFLFISNETIRGKRYLSMRSMAVATCELKFCLRQSELKLIRCKALSSL